MTPLTRPSTWLGASGALAFAVLALAACSKSSPEDVESETPVPVTTAMAEVGRITAFIHASGLVTPAPGAELIVVAPESSRVAEIPKGEGETVRRGDLLVRFEIPSSVAEVSKQRAEISRAEARLTAAQATETRMRDLLDRGVAARKEVEAAAREIADAQADLAGARAATTAAETVAARSSVHATFDGIVSKRQHNPGDLVEPTAADFVMRVVDPRRLEVAAQVSIKDAPRVRMGAPGRIAAAEGVAPTAALTVASRPAAVQEGTATVPIRLAFKNPANYPVATPVQIQIDAETHNGVVLVPVVALVHEGEETAVFVLMGEMAQRRAVKVGLVDEEHAEIVSGVKSGETVITSNQNGLPDGAKVTVTKPAEEDAAGEAPKDREVNIGALAVRQARAASLITLALVVAGAIAAFALPSSIYPPLEFPRIVIIAHSGTLPPQSMMLTVTRPIETAVMEVPGIRRVRSRSIRGASEISAQFDPSTDMVVALQQVQNRVSETQGELPADTDLTVERLTPAVFPILILSMTGPLATADLNDYATYVVRPELARVPGAGQIEVLASDTREIEVILDPAKIAAAGLAVTDVADALKAQNQLLPVGRFREGGQQHLSLASGLWTSPEQIASTPVVVKGGATVRVSDLGEVRPGSPDRTILVTGNGRDAVSISVSQQIGANILSVKQGVDAALASLKTSLPAGIHITKVYDLAEFVADAITNVRDAILIGGFLAIVVLIVFLRNVRLTLIAAVTLPLAVIPTFLFMRLFHGSINLMSMGGLAVAIGLVIDDAVVVVENIHRRAAEGADSAIDAVQQLMAPLVSSTLTTVVVFAPLGLLSGVIGQFFRALSMSLSVAVLMSLALSVTIVPVLARRLLRGSAAATHAEPRESTLTRVYSRMLTSIVHRPIVAVLFALVLAALSGLLYYSVGTGFLPKADEGGFVVDYLTPAGSALEDTDRIVRAMEKVISDTPEVASYSRRTGSELGLFATAQNSGDILVRLKPRGQRSRSSEEVISDMRPKLQEAAPLTEIEFVQLLQDMLGDLEGAPTPIEIKIFGDDPERLAEIAEPVEEMLGKVDGVVDVVGVQSGNPEVTWNIDSVASQRVGMTVEQVADQMAANWLGEVLTDLRLLDRRIPVRVRLPDAYRFDPQQLPNAMIHTPSGGLVPVSALATPVRANGQAELLRENLRQMAEVSGHLEGRDMGSAIAEIRTKLAGLKLPVGYTVEIGGQYASQQQAFRELLMVFAIAVVLVFIILVIQFRAWLPAILILLAAPLSLGGAFFLLWITGTDLNVSSAMGIILLIGLVVKNGIMLLDFSEHLHEQGEPFDTAIAHAGRIRLRPILMTTFCTLFGLLPLALGIGAGAELQKPLALAVIGGLALSTPVTLLAIPGLYAAVKTRKRRGN